MTRRHLARAGLWFCSVAVCLGVPALAASRAQVTAAPAEARQDPPKAPASDAPPATRSVRDGVFSEAQAARGGKIFDAECGSCHKPEQFTGAFLDGWAGRTVSGLFATIQTSMPEKDPGSLARREYADILAFIFKKNGLPAGPDDLPSASADLRLIVIGQ